MNFTNNMLYNAKSTVLVVLTFVLAGIFTAEAQLFVKENTILTVNRDLASDMEVNEFQSSVGGASTLWFVGQSQNLFVSADQTIPSTRIIDATQLTILSPLHITGNLTVDAGVLVLHHTVKVEGNLRLSKEAAVQNGYFIQLMNQQLIPLDSTPNQNTNWVASAGFLLLSETNSQVILILPKKQVFTTTNAFYQAILADITKPPPQIG